VVSNRPTGLALVLGIVRDPNGQLEPRSNFSAFPTGRARHLLRRCIQRWTFETTFEETWGHLGVDSQPLWSDQANARTTLCLFGLYSVVTLLAHALHPKGKLPAHGTAWSDTPHATFADLLAAVQRQLWGDFGSLTSARDPDCMAAEPLSKLLQRPGPSAMFNGMNPDKPARTTV
jgi:hypothetical protein